MSKFPYQFFEEYVVRTPGFSLKEFKEKLSKDEISDIELKEICRHSIFIEAIYLASPSFYKEMMKWMKSEKQFSQKEEQKLKQTLLKYYSRMSTRCTPFGLFSEIGLGSFDKLRVANPVSEKIRDTKLDMSFLISLAQHFVQLPYIRNKLLFSPNNSIYKTGNRIRYMEYQYTGEKREYIASFVPLSLELQRILDFSKKGKTVDEISGILVNEEITKEEAIEFIEELINNQLLVSQLEPNISGNNFLDSILTILNKIEAKVEINRLIVLKKRLNELDLTIGNPITLYTEIEELIKSFKIDYKQNHLFQTDLYNTSLFYLPVRWKKDLKKSISFLNKITVKQEQNNFSKFKKAFYKRFETQEMPLLYVLDPEIGIGYKQNSSSEGIHPYIEDLELPTKRKNQNKTIELNPIHCILNEKLQEAFIDNQYNIILTEEDFKSFEEDWNNLPDTISVMAEIISENKQEKLLLNGSSGSSAANLLGRFCSEKSELQNLTKTITKKEEILCQETYNNDKILAEIIHLPEARIGNVTRRPILRTYEIPYLAQSTLPMDHQILVEDLLISMQDDRIVLRSKKLNKEIKPCLTNAHNYYTNTLPIYHFLADLYTQNCRAGFHFNWGGLEEIYNFFPRVEYQNIILSKARWKMKEKDITSLELLISSKKYFLHELDNWRNKRKMPEWIQVVKFDHTLTLNLKNYDMAKLFIQTITNEKFIIIEEFLYNENDHFKREFIFPLYRRL